ncbi:bifunctional precorrin-2 dehydrogenase/sirohydrochlorin ferrochelatase [Klebsiella variicola subsp. variicola]|nr:bifunctional precorrin-2 dehydrogenase/sirohydrochlorin ferrochelatase [Klebsiella variicola subsp. variicola]
MIGGDEIAERKIKFLLRAQAQVQVVAGTLSPALADLAARQALSWRATEFSESLVDDVFLVIAATEDEALNQRVFAAANARYRLVNVVDNQALCSFVFPSIVDRFAAAGGDLLQRQSAGAVAYSARENWKRCCRRTSGGWRNRRATGATI